MPVSGSLSGLMTAPMALAIVAQRLAALVLALLVAVPRAGAAARARRSLIGVGWCWRRWRCYRPPGADTAGGRAARAARARTPSSSAPGAGARLAARLPRRRAGRRGRERLREGGVRQPAKRRRRGRLHGGAADAARRRGWRTPDHDEPLARRSPACAAPSSSTASASPPMCWRPATAAPPSAAPPSRCSATPARSRPT